jgi:hypothetical protein
MELDMKRNGKRKTTAILSLCFPIISIVCLSCLCSYTFGADSVSKKFHEAIAPTAYIPRIKIVVIDRATGKPIPDAYLENEATLINQNMLFPLDGEVVYDPTYSYFLGNTNGVLDIPAFSKKQITKAVNFWNVFGYSRITVRAPAYKPQTYTGAESFFRGSDERFVKELKASRVQSNKTFQLNIKLEPYEESQVSSKKIIRDMSFASLVANDSLKFQGNKERDLGVVREIRMRYMHFLLKKYPNGPQSEDDLLFGGDRPSSLKAYEDLKQMIEEDPQGSDAAAASKWLNILIKVNKFVQKEKTN